MLRLMFFLLGFGLSIIGFSYIITYLNYLSIGYDFNDYIKLIIKCPECLIGIIGLIILGMVIFTRRDEHGLRL